MKGALPAYSLGKVLQSRPEGVKEETCNDVQEQVVSTVILYLQPSKLKLIREH
jgi:hypothetical protein